MNDIDFEPRTTEAPVLAATHSLRIAFTRYGKYAARHVLTTLLVSVAVAALLIYPFPFLYTTDFTNGASNIPLHVWTDAQPLNERPVAEPDVIMRTIWVHGSYMKALDRQVILGALELQDEILGPMGDFDPQQPADSVLSQDTPVDLTTKERDTFHVINGLTNQSWFFHSPLQYWSCDANNILQDHDILATVNEKKKQPTSVNGTLRHSIVFSGKHFEDRKLIAADALVITLIHLRDSPVGKQWVRKTEEVASRMADKWDIFPQHGVALQHQLFEFQFRPISMQDTIILGLAYGLTATYFVLSLSKIRAVKSKLGLMVTAVAQIALAIMSSLTVCALFKIDLSRIPRAAYPLVLMAMSLENIFRLINSVIVTPADHSTSSRIGHAFGETGHIALASVMQNILILWGLSKVVSSGVSAFCTFAAIAILFDFFYLSTFFLSVLSVDVRRTELSDALEKAAAKHNRSTTDLQPRQSLLDAVLQGKIALSTRIAGTIVMLGFILVAQWHFFENENTARSPGRILRFLWKNNDLTPPSPAPLTEIHQARSPKSWLRLQDHETAKEVIDVVKPWAHSYIARVYDPVIFVLRGADRNPPVGPRWFPDAVYDFAHHHMTPFIVTVLVIVAAVRLLMNYLLWDELLEANNEQDSDDEPLLSIKSLDNGHQLDIAMLSAAPDGQIVSVGLDRVIRTWNVRSEFASHVIENPKDCINNPFPVLAMAIDNDSNWVALLSSYRVLLWSLANKRWGPSMAVELYGQKPEAFFFGSTRRKALRSVVIVRRNGTMVELWNDVQDSSEYVACKTPLICAVCIAENRTCLFYIHPFSYGLCTVNNLIAVASNRCGPRLSVVTLSRRGCVHRVTLRDGIWVSEEVKFPPGGDKGPNLILPVNAFSSYLVVLAKSVDLVDLHSSAIIHTFQTEPMQPRSLKFVYYGQRLTQSGIGTVASMTLAYTNSESGQCVLQTYVPDKESEAICFSNLEGPPSGPTCTWIDAGEVRRRMQHPGVWTPLRNGSIVGVRQRKGKEIEGSHFANRLSLLGQSGLRKRGPLSSSTNNWKKYDAWEVWVVSQLGRGENIETRPLDTPEAGGGLIISELGPMVKLGYGSVAVGFGNVIKLITVGHERFDSAEEGLKAGNLSLTNRRKKPPGPRPRASSNSFAYT